MSCTRVHVYMVTYAQITYVYMCTSLQIFHCPHVHNFTKFTYAPIDLYTELVLTYVGGLNIRTTNNCL